MSLVKVVNICNKLHNSPNGQRLVVEMLFVIREQSVMKLRRIAIFHPLTVCYQVIEKMSLLTKNT